MTHWLFKKEKKTPKAYPTEHRLVVEHALGYSLDTRHPIHHFDENSKNNRNCNLVVCEDKEYRSLLHVRQRVVAMGGDPNLDKRCGWCKELHPKTSFAKNQRTFDGLHGMCRSCCSWYRKDLKKRRA